MEALIRQLYETQDLDDAGLAALIDLEDGHRLFETALRRRREWYGDAVYKRGLIEFTNYCKNNCYYCGIRAGNRCVTRYRLTEDEILDCCDAGRGLGFRTFVLQGGEDPYWTDDRVTEIVGKIKKRHPDCAVTLSIGEKSYEAYKSFFDAGADRYLLRHETADAYHYAHIHPKPLNLENRMRCLRDLKKIGYQVGSGFMVGSPGQKIEYLVKDLRFLQELRPAMIGIGPFLPHKDTPFGKEPKGSLKWTLNIIAIMRLMFPYALIPSTTALGTIASNGRELGLQAGANVVMPNLSPSQNRKDYALYDNKIYSGAEAAQSTELLEETVRRAGFRVVVDRGDVKKMPLGS